jgi:hypothetical protein
VALISQVQVNVAVLQKQLHHGHMPAIGRQHERRQAILVLMICVDARKFKQEVDHLGVAVSCCPAKRRTLVKVVSQRGVSAFMLQQHADRLLVSAHRRETQRCSAIDVYRVDLGAAT